MEDYPNGADALRSSVEGGELFLTFLYTPVSIHPVGLPNVQHVSNIANNSFSSGFHEAPLVSYFTALHLMYRSMFVF